MKQLMYRCFILKAGCKREEALFSSKEMAESFCTLTGAMLNNYTWSVEVEDFYEV